jgi:glycosyltransferase involved in cell wall biosynthesis
MPARDSALLELIVELAGTRSSMSASAPGSAEREALERRFAEGLAELRRRTPAPKRAAPGSPLEAARRAADILHFDVPPSHRPRLGRWVTLGKKSALAVMGPVLARFLAPQRGFNQALLEVLEQLLAQAREEGRPVSAEQVRGRLWDLAQLPAGHAPGLKDALAAQAEFNQRAVELAEVSTRGAGTVEEANAQVASLAERVDPLRRAPQAAALRALQPLWREVLRRQLAFNTEVMLVFSNLLNGRPPVVAPPEPDYRAWYEAREPGELAHAQRSLGALRARPRMSLLMPAWETPPRVLEQAIASVKAQLYDRWELCVVDDGSRSPRVRRVVEEHARSDPRIRYRRLEGQGSIARATNAALELATGEWVGFIDHDDTLAPHALAEMVLRLDQEPGLDWLYSDEDRLAADGRGRHCPMFKPDFSPELLRSHNYICHFVLARTALVRELGGIREGFQGAQDYDFLLRLSERSAKVAHVPRVLYHWRQSGLSLSSDEGRLRGASAAGAQALREHLQRRGEEGEVLDGGRGEYRIRYPVKGEPLVSIIVPFKDRPELLEQLTRTLLPRTAYRHFELLLVSNNSTQQRTAEVLASLTDPRVRKLEWNHPFNYPAINNWAARQAKGELLLFLNNDMEIEDPRWLEELVSQVQRPGVGMVGPKLRFPDGSIQHAGVVVGICGYGAHPFWRFPDTGIRTPFGTPDWNRNYLAVTSACLILPRDLFWELEGYDERFRVCGSDVDLGIRVVERGLQVIYTAGTWLYHHESASRRNVEIPEEDLWHSVARYRPWLQRGDPFYNPNLDLTGTDCALRQDDLGPTELAAQALCAGLPPPQP